MENEEFKPKSFWEKPEGKTGMLFNAALLVAGGYGLFLALPFMIVMMRNTITAIGLAAVLAAIIYLALDNKFRTLISYGYKSLMRGITKMFVELDPIRIVEIYVDEMKKSLRDMNAQISNLKGQMRKLKDVIDKNNLEMQNNLKMASKAKETGNTNVLILKSRKAGRLQESNVTLQNLYTKLEVLYRVLSKMYENTGYIVEDLSDEVSVKKREYEAIRTGYSAFKSALKVINGDPDKKAVFEQAMEVMADRVGQQVGEIERFLDVSKSFMESIDLQNGVFEEDGLAMMEKWEKENSLILGEDKQTLILMANKDVNQTINLDEPMSTGRPAQATQSTNLYSDLLK